MTPPFGHCDDIVCCQTLSGACLPTDRYRIAGTGLVSTFTIRALEPFRTDARPLLPLRRPTAEISTAPEQRITTRGWLANAWRTVSSTVQGERCRLRIEGLGRYAVDHNAITALDPDIPPHDAIITGPCLILALAMRSVFMLHASAITLAGEAIAFTGESGVGKSTLAHWAVGQPFNGRSTVRLADDLLPVAALAQGITALPHFPQLKLNPRDQYTDREKPFLPLRALFVLNAETDRRIVIEPLPTSQAMLQVIRHTVAARLFGAALHRRHLAFAARSAKAMPVYRLHYPRRLEAAPELFERILALKHEWPASH